MAEPMILSIQGYTFFNKRGQIPFDEAGDQTRCRYITKIIFGPGRLNIYKQIVTSAIFPHRCWEILLFQT